MDLFRASRNRSSYMSEPGYLDADLVTLTQAH